MEAADSIQTGPVWELRRFDRARRQAMAEIMRDMGCDYLQGYYYSRPLPIDEFIAKYGA